MTTVLRRLRAIEAHGYVRRIEALENGGHAWCLTKSAARHLGTGPAKLNFPRFILEHDLKLAALRMRLEEVNIAKSWRSEHVIRSKMAERMNRKELSEHIIPDGIMGVLDAKGFARPVAIELELTSKNQMRYREIQREYAFKNNLYAYWYIVRTPAIGRKVIKSLESWRDRWGYTPTLHVSLFDDVMKDPLDADVIRNGEKLKLREIFLTAAKADLPAHTYAHSMSGQNRAD